MTTEPFSLATTIILILPMGYFFIASLTFFLAKFEDPVVSWMLRGLFNVYFLSLSACLAAATVAFAWAGRPIVVAGLGSLFLLALWSRRWFLQRVDAQLRAREGGDTCAPRRLRRLHVSGIAYNAMHVLAVMTSIPFVFPPTT